MFTPLVIVSKPNTKRRDFICGKWVDVKPEDVYVGSIEAKETKMIVDTIDIAHRNRFQCRHRKARHVVEDSVRISMNMGKTYLHLGYVEAAHKHFAEARFALKVMAQHRDKLERLP